MKKEIKSESHSKGNLLWLSTNKKNERAIEPTYGFDTHRQITLDKPLVVQTCRCVKLHIDRDIIIIIIIIIDVGV
jgi:hypothetical protein